MTVHGADKPDWLTELEARAEEAEAEAQAWRKRCEKLEAALQLAVLYLDHPDVRQIPFARRSGSVARHVRKLLASPTPEGRT